MVEGTRLDIKPAFINMFHMLKNVTQNEYEEVSKILKNKQNGTHRGNIERTSDEKSTHIWWEMVKEKMTDLKDIAKKKLIQN